MRKTTSNPKYTFTKRAIYYYSRLVPSDLRHHYRTARLVQSLKTRSTREACKLSRLLEHDPSQVSYYENIVDRMPGKVLKGHSVVTKDRTSQTYHLTLTEQLSDRQKADLLALCHQRKASKPCKAVRCCTLSLRYWPPVPRWNYLNEFLS